jgi:flagellar hook-associated protein 2
MSISALTGLADTLLATLLQRSLSASHASDLASLFLPPQLADPTATLSASDLAAQLSGARGRLLDLTTAATALDLANPTSVFFSATISSSDSSVATGAVIAGTSPSTTPATASYTFTVSQLAVAQANVGTALSSNTANGFQSGTNTFQVTQNGVSTNVSFSVTNGDSNLTVLTNMAAAINNNSALGITASVHTDAGAGTSQLVVQAKQTGTANTFTLTDVSKSAISDAGVASATTAAANASYTQNGVALTSSTNELYIDTGAQVKVTLLSTSSTPVVLTVGPDKSLISGAIASLATAYDSAKGFFDSSTLYPGTAAQLGSVVSRLRAQLSNIGVMVGAGGGLSVDSTALSNAITRSPSAVQQALGDVGGLAKELRAIGDTQLSQGNAGMGPVPPFNPGYAPRVLAGMFASRLQGLRATGLLVDALI